LQQIRQHRTERQGQDARHIGVETDANELSYQGDADQINDTPAENETPDTPVVRGLKDPAALGLETEQDAQQQGSQVGNGIPYTEKNEASVHPVAECRIKDPYNQETQYLASP